MGIRKNYLSLTYEERDRLVQALYALKQNGMIDEFARIHDEHFSMGIHRSSHFLPWHREMLYRFERELQAIHPDITIPYWDSTVDQNSSDPLWNNNFLGQFDSAWSLNRVLGSVVLPTAGQVQTNQDRETYDAFWRELERVIHNPPHNWVSGIMATAASPGDPIFYLHHCWIDMLWAQWQFEHRGVPFVSSGPGLGLNDSMMEWPDRTPADVLDHHALGYQYDTEPVAKTFDFFLVLTWAWIIILGALMITPDGIECIACGPSLTKIIGVVSVMIGVAGFIFDRSKTIVER